jgi:pilus assembly protein CpaB
MRRSYIGLIVGIVFGIVAIVAMRFYVSGHSTKIVDQGYTQVAVAAEDLSAGSALQPEQVRMVRWPVASVPEGAFNDAGVIFKDVKGPADRVILINMVRGEPLLASKISGLGARPIMSTRVAKGMRAISIHIDDVSGVAGFILPGDKVDIMLSRHTGNGPKDLVTEFFMQGIKVLGIDQLADQKSDKPVVGHTATVEVTPEQAGKLVLAQQAGTLSLALRNPAAGEQTEAVSINEGDLISGHRRIVRSGSPSGVTVRVRYGSGEVVNKNAGQ